MYPEQAKVKVPVPGPCPGRARGLEIGTPSIKRFPELKRASGSETRCRKSVLAPGCRLCCHLFSSSTYHDLNDQSYLVWTLYKLRVPEEPTQWAGEE